tara:strand:+ start:855 stop:1760 length:906 start_codon:yes stop_codon:yes gene_type:complete
LYQRLIREWRSTQTSQADSSYPILVAVNQFINTVVAEEKGPYKHQISEELLDSLALAIRGMKIKESKLHEMYRINKRKNDSSVQIYFDKFISTDVLGFTPLTSRTCSFTISDDLVKEMNLLKIEWNCSVSIISKQSTPFENAAVIPQLCTDITTPLQFSTEFADKINPATMKPSAPSQSTIRKHNKACARLQTLYEKRRSLNHHEIALECTMASIIEKEKALQKLSEDWLIGIANKEIKRLKLDYRDKKKKLDSQIKESDENIKSIKTHLLHPTITGKNINIPPDFAAQQQGDAARMKTTV